MCVAGVRHCFLRHKGLVSGLKITLPNEFDRLCSGCMEGKSTRPPLPKMSIKQYDLNELLVIDLVGPMNVPTWDGYLYAFIIVEVSHRYPTGRLLKSKEESGREVCVVVARLECQAGRLVKIIHTDNGSEFINSAMNEFCARNGIKHETTNPYQPQQNGIAKRAIAVLMEMTPSMLHAARMDLHYWGEAFMYTVYIHLITPTSALKGKIPYTEWSRTGKKPDVSHLRIFGSYGWAHVPKEVRHGKLESRAVHVHMLGWWADETKGYRLEDLENGKLITSHDVQFYEDNIPSELAQVDTSSSHSTTERVHGLINTEFYPQDDIPQKIYMPAQPSDLSQMTEGDDNYVSASKEGTPTEELMYPSRPATPTHTPEMTEAPPTPQKSKKWDDLPRQAPSTQER